MAKKKLLGLPLIAVLIFAIVFVLLIIISALGGPVGQAVGINLKLPSWLVVSTPHPELPAEGLFHIGSFPVTNSLLTTWITIVFILIFSLLATRKMKLVPRGIQNIFEWVVSALLNMCESIAGPKYGRQIFPIMATIFLFVFINAWTSLIPGYGSITLGHVPLLRGANTDINVPLALAIISFITTWAFGFKASGLRFLSQFFQFKKLGQAFKDLAHGKIKSALGNFGFGVIDVFVGLIELLSNFIRLISFTFRLFGNMTAGEILLLSIGFLVPWGLSFLFYGLEMLIGFVQALAFSMLTLIFTSLAVAGHESEEHLEEGKAATH